jgi:hypothetical protein
MKEAFRVKIKHSLRQLSKENWLKYGKKRYRIESLFGNINRLIQRGTLYDVEFKWDKIFV